MSAIPQCAGCGRLLRSRHEVAEDLRALLSTFDEPGVATEVSRWFVEDWLRESIGYLECSLCREKTESP